MGVVDPEVPSAPVGRGDVDAASLRAAYESGYRARMGGRPRRTTLTDPTEAHAWLAGWTAADRRIFAPWPW